MNSASDVVITGLGVVSPIGHGVEAFWRSLAAGTSGIRVHPLLADTAFPFRIGGTIVDFDGKLYVKPRKSLKVMCPQIVYGYAAAQMAAEQAGLAPGTVDPDRLGTLFASETFYADPHEVALVFRKCVVDRCYVHDRWGEHAMREIMPLWMLKYLPNMVASHVSIALDARGPSNTICQAEASGHLALIEAIELLNRGQADAMVVGGTGSPIDVTALLYRGWRKLTSRTDPPGEACRPFDRDRAGMVMGEGAGAIVLERAAHAAARGASILGRIKGFDRGFCDPRSPAFGPAIARSIATALERSGCKPADVGHVGAVGISTVEDDVREAEGIAAALDRTPVFAPKSYFGNLGPATSIVELIAHLLALRQRLLPATLNYRTPDPRCPIRVAAEPREIDPRRPSVLLGSANTGQITTIVLSAAT